MVLTQEILQALIDQAKASPRLRTNYDLRNSTEDKSQRILNVLEPGTIIPIHRHTKSSESTAVIRGKIRQNFYDENGNITDSVIIEASGPCPIYVVPKGVWHNTECLESGTILFEAKDGAYEPLAAEDMML